MGAKRKLHVVDTEQANGQLRVQDELRTEFSHFAFPCTMRTFSRSKFGKASRLLGFKRRISKFLGSGGIS